MKILITLCLIFAASLFAEANTIAGQKTVNQSMVTWSAASGNWSNKTRLLFLGNNVYVDTSATRQAGEFKRIDNTADSCSNPFRLGTDTNGTSRPIWEYRLFGTFRSVDKDSGTHYYRVQTRERVYDGDTKSVRWTPWTQSLRNFGYADVSIVDTLAIPNPGTTAKVLQYTLGSYLGSWARLCPDDNAGTANQATDSVFADSLNHVTR